MNTTIQPLKGFRDFLPIEAAKRKWLREKLAAICESWGFEPLETPTLEPLELFTGQIGEDEKLFFKFKDQGDRDVALRYDQTVPTCRVIGQYKNTLTFPFKRYQIQPAFRAEKPQKGRYREFTQVDADIFGDTSPMADAETIALSLDIYRQLGFQKAVVRINSRDLFKGIPYEAITAIDKLKKIGEDGVLKEMEGKGISLTQAKAYLTQVKNAEPNEAIQTILSYLKNYGFNEEWYVFDPTIARSFAYSTGPIWEVEIPEYGNASVLGGERYDGMLTKIAGFMGGGTGFGLGFDRTLEAMEACGLLTSDVQNNFVLVTVFSKDTLRESLTIAQKIRDSGLNTSVYTTPGDKLEKQLKYADKKGIPYVLIQGPEEIAKGVVQMKNMKTREAKLLSLEAVIRELR